MKPSVAATAAALAAAPAAAHRAPGGGGFKNPAAPAAFKRPGGPGGGAAQAAAAPKPPPQAHVLHDPRAEGALVLNAGQWDGGRGSLARERPVSPVVVDPYLGRHLRPHQVGAAGREAGWAGLGATQPPAAHLHLAPPSHPCTTSSCTAPSQVEGVRFLYEAVMGTRSPGHYGCILAGAWPAWGSGRASCTVAALDPLAAASGLLQSRGPAAA